jgi:hypothetical protein
MPAPAIRAGARRASSEQAEQQRLTEAAAIRGRLLASSDPEHLAAAALIATEPGDRAALITQALARGSSNPLLVWTAARICSGASGRDACPVDELSERLLAIDPQNSETWMLAAVQRLKRGDDAGALDALRCAGAAADSRIYWAETVALVERAYAVASDYPFTERALNAFGIGAANLPRYGDYSKMCTTQSKVSTAWASACLAYGEQAERQGDTVIGVSIARSMQIAALKQLEDPARLAAVLARQQQAQAAARGDPISIADEQLMLSTPGLLARYLDVLGQQGEAAAMRWKRTEAARLRAELPPCAAQVPGYESGSPP